MIGYRVFIKSSSKIAELEDIKIAEKLEEKGNILAGVYKEIYTNELKELMLRVKGAIFTQVNNKAICNAIKTDSKWYKVVSENDIAKSYMNEADALEHALRELNVLCTCFNVENKEILTKLISKGD